MKFHISLLLICYLSSALVASPAANVEDERETRLLFSPVSRKSREKHTSDVHSLLHRRLNREGHHVSSDSLDQSPAVPSDSQPSMKELCHARALHKCGSAVISGFELPDLTAEQKCRIRENFLHCMIKNKYPRCRVHRNHPHVSEESVQHIRQQIVQLLWTARGCIIGLDSV